MTHEFPALEFPEVDRKTAIIAALPLLLFGLLIAAIAAFLYSIGGPSQIVNIGEASLWHTTALIVSAISFALLIFVAIVAIKTTLPIWTYTWLVAVLSGFIVSMNLVLDDRIVAISQVVDFTVVGLALLACLVIAVRIAVQGWRHTGLLSLGLCGSLGLALCFFVIAGSTHTYLGILSALLGVLEAVLIYLYIQKPDPVRIASITILGGINISIAWIVESIFRSTYPSRGFGQFWALAALLAGLLLFGTLSGVAGRFIRRKLSTAQS